MVKVTPTITLIRPTWIQNITVTFKLQLPTRHVCKITCLMYRLSLKILHTDQNNTIMQVEIKYEINTISNLRVNYSNDDLAEQVTSYGHVQVLAETHDTNGFILFVKIRGIAA